MTVSRMIARPLLASMFVVGGVNALRNASDYAIKAKEVTDRLVPLAKRALPQAPIPEDPATLVRINAAVHIGAGAALATGHFPRLASTALAATLVPTTLAGHQFWNESDPAEKANQPDPLPQEPLDAGWPPARRRRHRGPAGSRLAHPPRGPRRTPRSRPPEGQRPPRGQAGGRPAAVIPGG